MKTCTKCGEHKSLDLFVKNKKMKDGRSSWCKSCKQAYQKKWLSEDKNRRRRHAYKANFGITIEDYDRMLAQQDGKCAICSTTDPGGRYDSHFMVDHDHETGDVRGLLCFKCNTALGKFNDNLATLEAAVLYLKNQ